MSTRGITVYYRATLTTNAPVIENICTVGDGRVDSGSPVYLAWQAFGWWCSHKLLCVGVGERDEYIKGEGASQENMHLKVRFHVTCQGDIHLACVHMYVCVVSRVCVSEGCKEVSTSLNPLLQRNAC